MSGVRGMVRAPLETARRTDITTVLENLLRHAGP